jgi:polyisoprenyl-phosphate glycosyltransferase
MTKKLISILTPCFNEQENVEKLALSVSEVMDKHKEKYEFEHIFIDNYSKDNTRKILLEMASKDKRVKLIFNARNFGQFKSPYYGLLQCYGDAVISLAADFQEPPELIHEFIDKWEQGPPIVAAVKTESNESKMLFFIRKLYYKTLRRISETTLIDNFTGFGLYDKKIMDTLRSLDEPNPYFRGLVCELGFEKAIVKFKQPLRERGISSNNFMRLYDAAMVGITANTKFPLRLATLLGLALCACSTLAGIALLIVKMILRANISFGYGPIILISVFFFAGVQLGFIGMVGEYLLSVYTKVNRRPLVVEERRVNF